MKIRCVLVAAVLLTTIGLSSCDWFWLPDVTTLGFAPLAGAVHTTVTVVGQGFGAAPGDTTVTFDGVEATIVTWSDTSIIVRIPVIATPAGTRITTVEVHQGGALIGTGLFTVLRGVLFETNRDGNTEVYVMNPDGSQQTNLTNDADNDSNAIWSPDGTEIAFVSSRDDNSEIYVMDADGSNPMNLTRHEDSDFFPVWSPGGDKIAFMTDREQTGLVVLDAAPKIFVEFNMEIFVMNPDGSGQTNLTDDPAWDGYPSWSPDGSGRRPDRPAGYPPRRSWKRDLRHGRRRIRPDPLVWWSPEDDLHPMWSPDGSKIVFQSHRDGNWEIYRMNPDGSGQTRLTNHPDADTFPTWSPDGDWITYQSDRDGNTEIYKMMTSGSSNTRLTTSSDWDWGPSWSPDGLEIVFQSSRDGNAEIYRMNADGSFQTRLTNDPDWDLHPFWGTFGWMPLV